MHSALFQNYIYIVFLDDNFMFLLQLVNVRQI